MGPSLEHYVYYSPKHRDLMHFPRPPAFFADESYELIGRHECKFTNHELVDWAKSMIGLLGFPVPDKITVFHTTLPTRSASLLDPNLCNRKNPDVRSLFGPAP